jgi:hypothetical protein
MPDVWIRGVDAQPDRRAALESWKVDGWPEGWACVVLAEEDGPERFMIVPWDRLVHAYEPHEEEAARPQYGRA